MSMVKKGVIRGEIIGVSADDGAYICQNCKKVVLASQFTDDECCPFCKTNNSENDVKE